MAKFTVISDVTLELRRQIHESLANAPDVDFGQNSGPDTILIGPPDADTAGGDKVLALYLYHLAPSGHLRNQRALPDRDDPARFRKPPLPLELRYLLVPLETDETGLERLGRILQHFHDHRSFGTLDGEPIGDSFGGAANELRVSIDPLTIEQLSQLWSAFNSPFRLAVGLLVEVVAVDSALPPERIPRVEETLVLTGTKQ